MMYVFKSWNKLATKAFLQIENKPYILEYTSYWKISTKSGLYCDMKQKYSAMEISYMTTNWTFSLGCLVVNSIKMCHKELQLL